MCLCVSDTQRRPYSTMRRCGRPIPKRGAPTRSGCVCMLNTEKRLLVAIVRVPPQNNLARGSCSLEPQRTSQAIAQRWNLASQELWDMMTGSLASITQPATTITNIYRSKTHTHTQPNVKSPQHDATRRRKSRTLQLNSFILSNRSIWLMYAVHTAIWALLKYTTVLT